MSISTYLDHDFAAGEPDACHENDFDSDDFFYRPEAQGLNCVRPVSHCRYKNVLEKAADKSTEFPARSASEVKYIFFYFYKTSIYVYFD